MLHAGKRRGLSHPSPARWTDGCSRRRPRRRRSGILENEWTRVSLHRVANNGTNSLREPAAGRRLAIDSVADKSALVAGAKALVAGRGEIGSRSSKLWADLPLLCFSLTASRWSAEPLAFRLLPLRRFRHRATRITDGGLRRHILSGRGRTVRTLRRRFRRHIKVPQSRGCTTLHPRRESKGRDHLRTDGVFAQVFLESKLLFEWIP